MRHTPISCGWTDVRAPGTAPRRPAADSRSLSARIVAYLAGPGHSPMSAAGVHIGAELEAPTWHRHHTGRLLACLAAAGKVQRVRGGLYRSVATPSADARPGSGQAAHA